MPIEVRSCKRCGHEWAARNGGIKTRCPSCRSAAWETPKPPEVERGAFKSNTGQPSPLEGLQEGESRSFRFFYTSQGDVDVRRNLSLNATFHAYAKRHGFRLRLEGVDGGSLRVTRLAPKPEL